MRLYWRTVLIREIGAFAEGKLTRTGRLTGRNLLHTPENGTRAELSQETPPATGKALSLVVSTGAPASAAAQPLIQSNLAGSPAATASASRYVASADRVLALSDLGWKLCVGLVVLIVVAWAVGALPAAVRLF